MNIALCDDEGFENDNLYSIINEYAVKKDYDIRCTKFTSPKELLQREKFDLYFLDYIMNEMNGVELAKELKKKFKGTVYKRRISMTAAQASDWLAGKSPAPEEPSLVISYGTDMLQ